MFSRIEYLSSEVMGPPEALILDSNGSARFESYSNLTSGGKEPVGTFETRFDAAQISALASAINSPPIEQIPDHWGKIASGEGYRAIRVIRGSETVEKRIGRRRPVDPAMETLMRRLDRVADEVKRHPVRNLSMRSENVKMNSSGDLEATLILSNPGTETVAIGNPAYPGMAATSVRVQPDVPDIELQSTDIIDTKAVEVRVARRGAAETAEPVLEIQPGGSLSFVATFRLGAKPEGKRVARFRYQQTASERNGRPVLATELYSPKAPAE